MANEEQLSILRQGVEVWNKWRKENRDIQIDLSRANLVGLNISNAELMGANLHEAKLSRANLRGADLSGARGRAVELLEAKLNGAKLNGAKLYEAILSGADLSGADLSGAKLIRASLIKANLIEATLSSADLSEADLSLANLSGANLGKAGLFGANLSLSDLSEADLRGANLRGANLIGTNLNGANLYGANLITSNLVGADITNANLSKSYVYGVNVWDLKGEFKEQKDLIITPEHESSIMVDNIKVAQFVYLILNNKELRDVINTLTSKTVLILGRFMPERKAILDALRNKVREYDLLPIVFDFERPTDKDFTETIKMLAGISYFVIADVTNPKSSPLELQATVPDYQIPFVPIIQEGESPFAMMVDLQKKYPWVLPTRSYDSIETLMSALKPGIIDPAVEMRNKLRLVKAQEQVTESLRDYVDKTL